VPFPSPCFFQKLSASPNRQGLTERIVKNSSTDMFCKYFLVIFVGENPGPQLKLTQSINTNQQRFNTIMTETLPLLAL